MNAAVLALLVALCGAKYLPPESIVPEAPTEAAAYYQQLGDGLASWFAHAAAVRNYQKSLEAEPDRIEARLGLVRSLVALGAPLPALQQLQLVLKEKPDNPLANRLYAQFQLEGGKPGEAEKVLRRVVARNKEDAAAHRLLGFSLFAQKKFEPAETELRTAIRLAPRDAEAYRVLANVMMAMKRPSDGLTALQRYLELRPDDTQQALQAAELFLRLGYPEQAVALALKVLQKTPNDPRLLMAIATTMVKLNRREEAAKFFAAALKVVKEPAVVLQAANFLAQYHAAKGQYALAAADLRRVVSLRPELLPPRLMMVRFQTLAGDWRGAAGTLRALVALQPDNLGFRMQLFDLYLRSHSYAAAQEAARQIGRRWPGPGLIEQLAQGFLVAGRPGEAVQLIQAARRQHPNLAPLTFLLYQLHRGLGHERQAEALMGQLHKQFPDDPIPRHELAAVAFRQGRWQAVIELLEPLVPKRQIAPEVLPALAWAYERKERYREAADLFEAFAGVTNQPIKMTHVARNYGHLGDWATAIRIYLRLLEQDPKHVPTTLALARALGNSGEFERALATFQRVVQLDPKNALAWHGVALACRELGRLNEAQEAYLRLAAVDPTNPYAPAEAGGLELEKLQVATRLAGRPRPALADERQAFETAMATWLAGLERLPDAAVLHRKLAEAYQLRNDYPAAIARYAAAAEQDLGDFTSRLNAAVLSEELHLWGEARRWYRSAMTQGPETGYVYRRWLETFAAEGQPALGVESGLQLLDARPYSDLLRDALVEQATRSGQLALLRNRLDHRLSHGSRPDTFRDAYGLALARGGEPRTALEWYQKLAAETPTEARWPMRQGEVLRSTGQSRAALGPLRQASRIAPSDEPTLKELAAAEAATGQDEAAKMTLRRLIAIDPKDDDAFLALVRLYAGEGRAKEAMLGLRELLQSAGPPQKAAYRNNPALLTAYGLAAELAGDPAEAITGYRSALQANSHYLTARAGLRRLEQGRRPLLPGLGPTPASPGAAAPGG